MNPTGNQAAKLDSNPDGGTRCSSDKGPSFCNAKYYDLQIWCKDEKGYLDLCYGFRRPESVDKNKYFTGYMKSCFRITSRHYKMSISSFTICGLVYVSDRSMLGYIFAQSPLLHALLLIMNVYSVYSIYFGVGHFNFFQEYMNKFVFRLVRTSKVSLYLKYLLLRDTGW